MAPSGGGDSLKSNGKQSMDEQLNQVFELIESRSRGQVANDDVENAVSKLLASSGAPPKQSEIQQDTDDYDNLDEEPVANPQQPKSASKQMKSSLATIESMRKDEAEEEDPLDTIPLGKSGARMLVTFGDGHNPNPETVSAALLATRRCLHVAIKDARALRRHQKDEYMRARKVVLMSQKKPPGGQPTAQEQSQEAAGAGMLYRAMEGYDKLAYDPKCGFDIEQLKQLFPEEMRAYNRWNEMHQAYQESSKEDAVATKENESNKAPESDETSNDADAILPEGHLQERAAQFDARTELMDDDWYMKFSVVRQGSFLPRNSGRKSEEEKQWEANRKENRGRGRPKNKQGNWEGLPASCVRFLHWVGFDPRSALPPPNEESTEALAFLGYDFMGRIVEKAIYLRNVAKKKGDTSLLLELQDGEQLAPHDIQRALNDSSIRPVPLFSSLDSDPSRLPVAAQLYFGPGFEDRLEMEMDELASGKKRKHLAPEEQEFRESEDELFARLAEAQVAFDGLSQVIGEEAAMDDSSEQGILDAENAKQST